MLFVRFCSAALSAYVFTLCAPGPYFLLRTFSACGGEFWDVSCEEAYVWYGKLALLFRVQAGLLWFGAWVLLEVAASSRPGRGRRSLTHLRYGPLAVLTLACATVAG